MKILVAVLLLAACNDDAGELDVDVVTSLPPGDASGTALSGSYRMESVTTKCSGDCRTTVDDALFSACDVGTRLDDTIAVTQTDGALQIDVDGNDYVSRLEGGIHGDGGYDVGGLRTQLGGQITITARTRGVLATSGMTGTGRLHVGGRGIDCTIEVDVTGARR
jgi:hypothetical protein